MYKFISHSHENVGRLPTVGVMHALRDSGFLYCCCPSWEPRRQHLVQDGHIYIPGSR